MAKNKILGLMNAFQGLKEITGIALCSFRKTSLDALKNFMENKAIFEKPKEVQSKIKDVGLEAIRNLKLQKQEASIIAEKQQKPTDETYDGIFTNAPIRKPGSKP
ncbi:hypothetical protein KR032_004807 [Drosophila birchii]|nr:hypothetical protein KR032_004807 [Drosophila birchii]